MPRYNVMIIATSSQGLEVSTSAQVDADNVQGAVDGFFGQLCETIAVYVDKAEEQPEDDKPDVEFNP